MSDRRVLEALKALNALSKQKSNKEHLKILSEVSERVKSLLDEDSVDLNATQQLREYFSTGIVAIYGLFPSEALKLAGEVISYIAEIKLANIAPAALFSPSTHFSKSYEQWTTVLDRGLISGIQAYQATDHHDKVLLGEGVFPALARIWKSPLRTRLPVELKIAIMSVFSDSSRKCTSNARILLNPKVFGSDQFGHAIATTHECLILEILFEVIAIVTHASKESDFRDGVCRDIFLSRPMKAAFGADKSKDFCAWFISATKAEFSATIMKIMQAMSSDIDRPQMFKAINIIVNGSRYQHSSERRSFVVDQDSFIINTVDETQSIDTIPVEFSTVTQITFNTLPHRRLRVHLGLSARPQFLCESLPQLSEPNADYYIAFEISSDDELHLRDSLQDRRQSAKISSAGSSLKRQRTSKISMTAAIHFSKPDRSSEDPPATAIEKREEIAEMIGAHLPTSPQSPQHPEHLPSHSPTRKRPFPHIPVTSELSHAKLGSDLPNVLVSQIFDVDDLSDAPSLPAPASVKSLSLHRSASVLPNVPDASSVHPERPPRKAAPKLKPSAPLVSDSDFEPEPEPAPAPKRRKVQTPDVQSPAKPDSTAPSRSRASAKKYKGTRRPMLSLTFDSPPKNKVNDQTIRNPANTETNVDGPLRSRGMKPKAKPPPRSRPTRGAKKAANEPAPVVDADEVEEEIVVKPSKSPAVKRNTRRIMSDLEPALLNAITRSSPPSARRIIPAPVVHGSESTLPSFKDKLSTALPLRDNQSHEPVEHTDAVKPDATRPATSEFSSSRPQSKKNKSAPWKNFESPTDASAGVSVGRQLSPNDPDDITLVQGDAVTDENIALKGKAVQNQHSRTPVNPVEEMIIDVDVDDKNDGFVALSPPPQRDTLVTEPPRPERSSRVKPIIERRSNIANAQTSSPTPGSQAERGVLALKTQKGTPVPLQPPHDSQHANQAKTVQHAPPSAQNRPSDVDQHRITKPPPVSSRLHRSVYPAAASEPMHEDEDPDILPNKVASSSPLLLSALKTTPKPSPGVRPRFSVSFANRDTQESSLRASVPARTQAPRVPSHQAPTSLAPQKVKTAIKPRAPVIVEQLHQDVDQGWASSVLEILNQIGEVVVESKRSQFQGVRHEVLVSRDTIVKNIQTELRHEVEVCVQHYSSFVKVNEQYDAAGNQVKDAFDALGEGNAMIFGQVKEALQDHDNLSLSKVMTRRLLKDRSLGPTFAAYGVTLA